MAKKLKHIYSKSGLMELMVEMVGMVEPKKRGVLINEITMISLIYLQK